jgi:signal transduction histidine kinase/CheY-like chemotaxis protein
MTDAKPVRILCMEDDPGISRLMVKRLERMGYLVEAACDGQEGLAKFAKGDHDVILLDANMPNMSGVEVLRILASQGNKKPVLMVTGSGDELTAVAALKAGASEYLIKDVGGGYFDLLPSVIEKVLAQYRLQMEKEQALEDLRESEERFRGIIESSHDYYWALEIVDPNDFSKAVISTGSHGLGIPIDTCMDQKEVAGLEQYHTEWSWADLGDACMKVFSTGQVISDIPTALIDVGGAVAEHFESEIYPLKKGGTITGVQGLSADVTRRKKSEERIKRFSEELKRSNKELESFAFMASHDLQEPLRKIAAFGERLKLGYQNVLGEQGNDYLTRTLKAAHRMQALIHDLLQLSRVGTQGQSFKQVDLGELIAEVLSNLEDYIADTGGKVLVEKAEGLSLPVIEGDSTQLYQLLQNIVGNALKFHMNGVAPVVKIWAEREPGHDEYWQIFVQDNGIGFEEKNLARIFNPFERLRARSEFDGTGLGLAICQRIVTRHRGTITAKSQPNQGTTFIVTLPEKQSV